jgi:hypothetical protein
VQGFVVHGSNVYNLMLNNYYTVGYQQSLEYVSTAQILFVL